MVSKSQRKHDGAVKNIADHPELLGLERVVESCVEVPIRNWHGRLITEIDVLFILEGNFYVPVEYKCNHTFRNEQKAFHQLIMAEKGVRINFGGLVQGLYYASGSDPYRFNELVIKGPLHYWRDLE